MLNMKIWNDYHGTSSELSDKSIASKRLNAAYRDNNIIMKSTHITCALPKIDNIFIGD